MKMGKIKYNYVVMGMVILVVVCFLVGASTATQTTLKEGNVELGVSGLTEAPLGYTSTVSEQRLWVGIDYEKRNSVWSEYYIHKGVLSNRSGVPYDAIPDVVVQPIELRDGMGKGSYGTGTLKVWKKGIADADAKLIYVDYEFDLNIDQTWQNSLSDDTVVYIHARDAPTGGHACYNALKEYFASYTGSGCYSSYRWGMITDADYGSASAFNSFSDEHGICIGGAGGSDRVLGSNAPHEQVDITYQTEFYNEYEVFLGEGYKGVNIIRVCPKCENKLTTSKVYVLDRGGNKIYETPFFKQDEDSIHTFPQEPIAVWLVAATMESGGLDKEVLLYDDTSQQEYCYITGYTYDAKIGTIIHNVKVDMGSERFDYSDDSGYYSIGFPEGVYTITASKDGFYDTTLSHLAFPLGGDYAMDIALIPKPPVSANPSILGLVRELPNYYPAKNQVVTIENVTWTATTTTNDFGYYIFSDLEAGDYYIKVARKGYEPNIHLIGVSDFHVLHNIDLEPKESNIIRLINEWFMKWWWLLLLLIALIVGALLVKGRGKKKTQRKKR